MSSESCSSLIFPEDENNVSPSMSSLYSSSAPNSSAMTYMNLSKSGSFIHTGKPIKVESIYTEMARLRDRLHDKDQEIARLQRETQKLKSVIEKSEFPRLPSVSCCTPGSNNHPTKKCGVSGESWPEGQNENSRIKPERHYKDFRSRQLIRAALSENDFLKNLDPEQVRDIVDFMHPQSFSPGSCVIQEGEPGAHLYVSSEGQFEIIQDTRHVSTIGPGRAFGELAVLYNCKRTATIRAVSDCKVWVLERRAFQTAMVKAGMRRIEDRLAFLRSIPSFKGLKPMLLARIADCLEVEYYPPGAYIIREGTAGHTFFIISHGRVRVTTSGVQTGSRGKVSVSESPKVMANCALDFDDNFSNMCVLRELSHGDYFGEQALLKEERRSANVIALPPGVECLTLDRESFIQLIGDLTEFQEEKAGNLSANGEKKGCSPSAVIYGKGGGRNIPHSPHINITSASSCHAQNYARRSTSLLETNDMEINYGFDEDEEEDEGTLGDANEKLTSPDNSESLSSRGTPMSSSSPHWESFSLGKGKENEDFDFGRLKLDDLEVVATLGVGGFGRVELVQVVYDTNRVFALKCLPKSHILATQQQDHVFAEKNILMSCRSHFIASLYCTFKDSKCIYFLMEACLGGEIWTLLRDKGSFDEETTRFVAACVILALDYLHERDIVFRDLKPENLMLANNGYVKLVDFGFSKVVPSGQRTWTFCGTPEYLAPEIILNRGHDRTVDYWALGVLLFELLSGLPPWGPMSADATGSDSSDPLATYSQILKGIDKINFPKAFGRGAVSIIRRLCRQVPGERLGAHRGTRDVMAHRWFQGFDWEGLKNHKIKPPIKPRVRNPRDTSNFDKFELDIEDTPDDLSGWDADF